MWNAAYNDFLSRKWGGYLKEQMVSGVILPNPVNFAYESGERPFRRSQQSQSHLPFRIQPRKEHNLCCHFSDTNPNNGTGTLEEALCGKRSHPMVAVLGFMEFPGILVSTSIWNEIIHMKAQFKPECLNVGAYFQSFIYSTYRLFLLSFLVE